MHQSPYKVRSNGTVALYSMVQDHEFRGGFFLSPEQVADKAPIYDALLDKIEAELGVV
jgi:hypothetical protein